MKKIVPIIVVAFCLTSKLSAQSIYYSARQQFQANPIAYNPAFAGSMDKSRFFVTANHTYYSNTGSRNLYSNDYIVSYDQVIQPLRGGVGIQISNGFQKVYDISSRSEISISYAPKFKMTDKVTISPGIKFGVGQRIVDLNEKQSITQFESIIIRPNSTTPQFKSEFRSFLSVGIMINTDKFYAGLALNNINSLKINRILFSNLYPEVVFQSGYTFSINENLKLTPSVIFKVDKIDYHNSNSKWNFAELNDNLMIKYKNFIGGSSLLGQSISAGFDTERLRLLYTIAPPVRSNLNHTISLRYLFNCRKSN